MLNSKQKYILIALIVLVLAGFALFKFKNYKIALNLSDAATPALISTSEITCGGVFLTPEFSTGGKTSVNPMTMRYINGVRHFLVMDGEGNILEFKEPANAPCNSDLNGLPHPSFIKNWGQLVVNNSSGHIPGNNAAITFGLRWDEQTNLLLHHWTGTYTGQPMGVNSFSAHSFGANSINTVGCWGVQNIEPPRIGGGSVIIPNWFANTYLGGKRWGLGLGGGVSSLTNGISMGPHMLAVAPQSGNACASGTDYPIQDSRLLMHYPLNNVGPNCDYTTQALGCTPTQAPTAPYPAKLGFSAYSVANYAPEWDPWDGHGWFTAWTGTSYDWYDDGSKHGIILAAAPTSGWLNTTIQASPAPTINTNNFYPEVSFAIPSLDTHDGGTVREGDIIWVQTCTINVDCDPDTGNGRWLSFVEVTSVNQSTRVITGNITSIDRGTGDHKPVVGGKVFLGELYAHGAPIFSRATLRLQIYDPAQLAQVAQGTRQSWQVEYNQEMDLTTLIKGYGCPTCPKPGVSPHKGIIGVVADPAAKQVLVFFRSAPSQPYTLANAVYVLNLPGATPPPTPPPGPTPPPPPSPTPTPTPPPGPVPPPPPVTGAPCTLVQSGVDALGHTWTIDFVWTMRDGVYSLPGGGSLPGAQGLVYKFVNGVVHVKDPRDNLWYRWQETSITPMGGYGTWNLVGSAEPTCTALLGDLNNDRIVNSLDWSIMNSKWFTNDANADLNDDGLVNAIDFSILNANWFRTN